jgi:formylglycine-generating enzyme required for sulfatase activity
MTFAIVRGPIDFSFDPVVAGGDPKVPRVRVPRSFALGTTEVTRGQFEKVLGTAGIEQLRTIPSMKDSSADCPVSFMSYFDAARFCRRLSELEHVEDSQMCYPPVDQIREGMTLPIDYLARTGYRVPTEAEWVAGCFGQSRTFYHFGIESDLCSNYARHYSNGEGHTGPVAGLMPNQLGLFDSLGNVYEWCEPFAANADVPADGPFKVSPGDLKWVVRGGAYTTRSDLLGYVSYRNFNLPSLKDPSVGFRIARTCR